MHVCGVCVYVCERTMSSINILQPKQYEGYEYTATNTDGFVWKNQDGEQNVLLFHLVWFFSDIINTSSLPQ